MAANAPALSLYAIEEQYMALLDTEALVTPEAEAEFQAESLPPP